MEHVGSALQQLGKAGLNVLASGIGMFGIKNAFSGPTILDRPVLLIFVVGGITWQEIQEISQAMTNYQAMEPKKSFDILIGSTAICEPNFVFQKLFSRNIWQSN